MPLNVLRLAGAILGAAADTVNAVSSAIDTKSPNKCPNCQSRLQRVGLPSHVRHVALGGTKCWNCGCQVTTTGEAYDGDIMKETKKVACDMAQSVAKDATWIASKVNKLNGK